MLLSVVTLVMPQKLIGWLTAIVDLNVKLMVMMLETPQFTIGYALLWNMFTMVVTHAIRIRAKLNTSQMPIGLLNAFPVRLDQNAFFKSTRIKALYDASGVAIGRRPNTLWNM